MCQYYIFLSICLLPIVVIISESIIISTNIIDFTLWWFKIRQQSYNNGLISI